ncbi:MFS transporter [Holophaga foetida]|uniref:MFS transporter n=1 Tax=Holophaga foetida TaxID=35839 RepID=UPI00024742CD|nr:MFS transporter [Holophaga foetida]
MSARTKDSRWAYWICMVTSFLVPFMISSLNLAIPAIGLQFQGSQYQLNWVVASFLLVTGSFLLPMGKLADLTGRVRIFKIGLALFFAGSLLCVAAPSIHWLIAFRTLQGFGASMIFSTSMALLTALVPPQERGKTLGINVGIVYFAYSSGPVLGGVLCSCFGWKGIFLFLAALALLVLIAAFLRLQGPWIRPQVTQMDLKGSLLCTVGLILLLYGSSSLSLSNLYWVVTLMGLVILAAFVVQEGREAAPILPITLFTQNRVFAFSNLSSVINYSSIFAMPFLLSLYLQTVRSVPLKSAGLILLVQPVVMAVLSPVVGRLSDRIEPRILSSLGMAVNTLGLLLFAFLGMDSSLPLILANLAFIGLGYALFSAPNTNAIMGSVDRTQYGVASSTMGTARVVGQALSMAIVSLITTRFVGPWKIGTPGYSSHFLLGMKACFIVFTILNFIGVFASLARGARQELSLVEG